MPKATALTYTAQVTAKSPYGVKLDDDDVWLNWSNVEYRKQPWDADDVQKGDWVEVERSKNFIKSIQIVEPPTEEPMVGTAKMRDDIHALADKMDEEDPFEGMETEPTPNRSRNPIVDAREKSIQKQVALKCAVELAIGMLGPVPEGSRAGPVNAAYVVSIFRQFRDALEE